MLRDLTPLLLRLGVAVAVAVAVRFALMPVGLHIPWTLLITLGLMAGAAWWVMFEGADRAHQLDPPRLDPDVDAVLPHGQDTTVRRLENTVYSAQPGRRVTTTALARLLVEIADERDRDPDAPPLSAPLTQLLTRIRRRDTDDAPMDAIDRRALHRILRELAAREERDR